MTLSMRFDRGPITVQTAGAWCTLIAERDRLRRAESHRCAHHVSLRLAEGETAEHGARQPITDALNDRSEQVNARRLATCQQLNAVDNRIGATQEI